VPNAKELRPSENWRILFVGRSGSGKSRAAASFPGPRYCYDLDGRIGSLRGIDIDYDQFKEEFGFIAIDKKMEEHRNLAKANKYPYKTTLYSSVTSTMKYLLLDSIKLIGEDQEKEGKGQMIGRLRIPGPRHYLFVSEAMSQIFDNGLHYFPGNVIVEAHVVNAYNSSGEVNGTRILATDKLSEYIPTKFDEVWEFSKVESSVETVSPRYWVSFDGNLARTTREPLRNLRKMEITNANFYEKLLEALKQ